MLAYLAVVAIGNFLLGFGFAAWRERYLTAAPPPGASSPPLADAQPSEESGPVNEDWSLDEDASSDVEDAPPEESQEAIPQPRVDDWSETFGPVFSLDLPKLRRHWLELQQAARGDTTSLTALTAEFAETSPSWAEALERAAQPLRELAPELPQCRHWAERLEDLLTGLARQLQEATAAFLTASEQDSPDALRQLLEQETERLLHAWHDLRDERDEAQAAVLAATDGLDDLAKSQAIDPQTGLPNRLGLELLHAQWRREQGELAPWSVALLDIDGFAQFNQRLGLAGGDQLLAGFATVLEDLVRKERGFDRAARRSGDSFALFLGDTNGDNAVNSVERLRQTLEASSFTGNAGEISLTVSLGVAEASDIESLADVLARAEDALRLAQKNGGNRTCLHNGLEAREEPPRPFQVKGRIVRLA